MEDRKLEPGNMSIEELKKLKSEWYAEACNSGKIGVCYEVGRRLGELLTGQCGPKYRWEREGVVVYVDDYGAYMTVTAGGKRVASTHYCDRLFVPGAWFDVILSQFQEAEARAKAQRMASEDQERKALLQELGLIGGGNGSSD